MQFLQKMVIKMVMAKKEKMFAMGLEMLMKSYEENKGEIAQKIFDVLPAKFKNTASPYECSVFIEVLGTSLAAIVEAAKPLFKENIGPEPSLKPTK